MRSTKVMAFSVPPELEQAILAHAKEEHRTISEYLREAVRHYMNETEFESAVKSVRKKVKAKGLKVADVEKLIDRLRNSNR